MHPSTFERLSSATFSFPCSDKTREDTDFLLRLCSAPLLVLAGDCFASALAAMDILTSILSFEFS